MTHPVFMCQIIMKSEAHITQKKYMGVKLQPNRGLCIHTQNCYLLELYVQLHHFSLLTDKASLRPNF